MAIERLPEDAQTIYAEALALALAHEGHRSLSHLAGTFTRKRVRGVDYVYFQYSDPGGGKRQFSIGRQSDAVDAIVREHERGRGAVTQDVEQLSRSAGLLRAAGAALVPHGPARVLRGLAEAGVFAAGGVLVGSYAFQVLGNMLGVRWPGAAWRTQDIDIATRLLVAVPGVDADVPKALEALQMGFVPVPQLDPRHPSTSFRVRGKPLSVDLITPGKDGQIEPVAIPRLRATAAPVKFLSLVMQDAQPAIATDGKAIVLVVVPSPARFAVHKLVVSQTRSVIQQTKGDKDLHQAVLLLESLAEDRPEDIVAAVRSFADSGPTVTKKIRRGLDAAVRRFADAEEAGRLVRSTLDETS